MIMYPHNMGASTSKKYFYKNGKKIVVKRSSPVISRVKKEKVNSIATTVSPSRNSKHSSISSLAPKKEGFFLKFKSKVRVNQTKKTKPRFSLNSLRNSLTAMWASLSVVAIFTFLISLMVTPQKARPQDTTRYAIYSSRPLTLQPSTTAIYSKDSRSQRINEVFKMYNCPLEGLGDVFVYEADKNDIPWWLVAAVSFQESSCGKNTPKAGGMETYNAWGWAVYGDMKFSFDNWARGIETVSRYFSTRFFSQGVTDTCEIMKTYTPRSEGSWCEGVNHFADIITDFKTEIN